MTNAELAILTLIAEAPRHGYQIEQVIEERGMREWTELGFSSIYYLLKKLEKDGLIRGRVERHVGQGPARKVYSLTAAGKEAVRAGVIAALSVPQKPYPPLQLGLANLPGISQAEAVRALESYRDHLDERLTGLKEKRDRQQPLPYFVEAMFSHSLALLEAESRWTKRFIKQLEGRSEQD
jgi:DNA-binding PadR family transcriptional regulator